MPPPSPPPAPPSILNVFYNIFMFLLINMSINIYAYLCILSFLASFPCICPRSVYYLFVVHFFTFWGKKHSPEVYTIFLWSIFSLFEEKPILQKCILFFCNPFYRFLKKNPFSRSVYYFFVVHFCVFCVQNVTFLYFCLKTHYGPPLGPYVP